MAKVITVNIQKGGCAKTTTCQALGSCFSAAGKKVLLIDLDPQGNLSYSVGCEAYEQTIYQVLRGEIAAEKAIVNLPEFDLIPANILLSAADTEFTKTGREYLLRDSLEELQSKYDIILLDTPPSLGILAINALTAANYVLIPSELSTFALQGMGQLSTMIDEVKKYCNRDLTVLGLILIKYNDRTTLNKAVKDLLQHAAKLFSTKIFETSIAESVKVREAAAAQQTLFSYAPDSKPLKNYIELASEILEEL